MTRPLAALWDVQASREAERDRRAVLTIRRRPEPAVPLADDRPVIDRPIPMPSAFNLKNGSKMRSRCSGSMPIRFRERARQCHRVRRTRPNRQLPANLSNTAHRFDGIGDQVQQDLLELNTIAQGGQCPVASSVSEHDAFSKSSCRISSRTSPRNGVDVDVVRARPPFLEGVPGDDASRPHPVVGNVSTDSVHRQKWHRRTQQVLARTRVPTIAASVD